MEENTVGLTPERFDICNVCIEIWFIRKSSLHWIEGKEKGIIRDNCEWSYEWMNMNNSLVSIEFRTNWSYWLPCDL